MSAMLESYDMPMLDYPGDLDIQMHPSSSDQWFQDEAKMEEDGPLKVPEIYSHTKPMKTDNYSQEKSIEIDMEPSAENLNVEYDMLDGEEIHHTGTELLDVEVYDVSLVHSPAMVTFDIAHEQPSDLFERPNSDSSLHPGLPMTSSDSRLESSEYHDLAGDSATLPVDDKASTYALLGEVITTPELSEPVLVQESEVDHLDHNEFQPQHYSTETETTILSSDDQSTELVGHLHAESVEGHEPHSQIDSRGDGATDHYALDQEQEDQTEVEATSASANASGDPHEISEGVYIDPPPPVLLSISSEDQFDFSLFNESPDWNTSLGTDSESHPANRVVLHHLPTLYYEPLSTVFDVLRQEDFLQPMFHMAESELVLEAVDLQLAISEDNIYAREVALHDLNVLHDVSGISGLLRMRLYASTPRFITRYQHLQEQVSRFHLEVPSGDVPVEAITEVEASHEEPQEEETVHEAGPVGALDNSLKTAETSTYPQEPGNEENDHHDEALSEVPTTESYDEASDLPPLPADTLDEEDTGNQEENEEDKSIEKPTLLSPKDYPSDRTSTPEDETYAPGSFSNNRDEVEIIALEALEASSDDESHTEAQHSDEFPNSREDGPASQEVAEDRDEEANHGTDEQQMNEKFDTLDNAVDGPEGLDSTFLVEVGDVAPVEPAFDHDDHINQLGDEDLSSNQKLDDIVEGIVSSEKYFNIEDERNLGQDANKNSESAADTVTFEEEDWENDLDGEGELDTTWDDENENALSNHSSVTLSSKASKRSFDEFESGGDVNDSGGGDERWTPPSSPDPKRSRTQ